MAIAQNFLPVAFFEKQLMPFVDAKLSIATNALHYGTGAFGGMRGTINPNNPNQVLLFRLKDHAKRLSDSAKFFNYDISPEYIATKIIEFIKANKPTTSFYIRPLVYISGLGISPRIHDIDKDFLIYGLELGDYLNPKGVSCRFSSWTRQEDRAVPLRGKITGSYTMAAMAKTEAVSSGFDECFVFNSQGKICEASAMNLFIVRKGKVFTPSVDQDILEGITRDAVIKIATKLGYEVIEKPIDKTEMLIADEVFLTGTAGKVTPVYKIENYNLPESHSVCDAIREEFIKITNGESTEFNEWTTVVDL
jgi:branched-chain amino acid aminotransferase